MENIDWDFLKEVETYILSPQKSQEYPLISYKNKGGKQEIAYLSILFLLNKYMDNEPIYDVLFDIQCHVCGFCAPSVRIWDVLLTNEIIAEFKVNLGK